MAKLQPVRGTHDLLPDTARRHAHIVETFRRVAELYGFAPVQTPIFEFTDVFQRTLGETSDVVTKEMYTFEDRGGDSLTLRPEATAGVARAFISEGLAQQVPLKLYTSGPMFRYERPQKGRMRQFHQLNVEVLGVAEPQADVEVIALGQHMLQELGLADQVSLQLNTLGDAESRAAYHEALVAYFSDHKDTLSEDSQDRLTRNPLRILDSKDEGDRALIAGAPKFSEYLNSLSADFFAAVCQGLEDLGIAYTRTETLVRGFDYYTHTAFEFVTDVLGSQGTVIGGGRYDRLIEHMGGQPTPGIGWGSGIERLEMMLGEVTPSVRPIAIIPVGADAEREALKLAHQLRHAGYTIELAAKGNLGKRMKKADKARACAALILGDEELEKGEVTFKELDGGHQQSLPREGLEEALTSWRERT